MSEETAPRELFPDELATKEALRENDIEKAHTLAIAADSMAQSNNYHEVAVENRLNDPEAIATNGLGLLGEAYDIVNGKPSEEPVKNEITGSNGEDLVNDVHKAEAMAYAAKPKMDKSLEAKKDIEQLLYDPGEYSLQDRDMRSATDQLHNRGQNKKEIVAITNAEIASDKMHSSLTNPKSLEYEAMSVAESAGEKFDKQMDKRVEQLDNTRIDHEKLARFVRENPEQALEIVSFALSAARTKIRENSGFADPQDSSDMTINELVGLNAESLALYIDKAAEEVRVMHRVSEALENESSAQRLEALTGISVERFQALSSKERIEIVSGSIRTEKRIFDIAKNLGVDTDKITNEQIRQIRETLKSD